MAEENARSEIPLRSLSIRTTTSPSSTPKSKPGTTLSRSSAETNAPIAPQKVTKSDRNKLTVESGVISQGELRRLAGEGDGVALTAESR